MVTSRSRLGLPGRPHRPNRPDWPEQPVDPELRSVMEAIHRQQSAMAADTSGFFMDLDLTMAQFRALVSIHKWGRMTGRELAGRLGVTPGTLVPLLDRLEEAGYLKRVPDREDRRQTWLELTAKGERLFLRLFGLGARRLMRAIAQLSATDREHFKRLVNQITDHLEAG
jgi:MarR family transcriptional regulator, 2-MHQ and catechol-resistance regulon repressor